MASWEEAHENQPIWSLELNELGNLLSVGSDSSVALWQAPSVNQLQTFSQADLNDPSKFLIARFRKEGKLGHFLTPTSASWLKLNSQFAISYGENVITLYDSQSG